MAATDTFPFASQTYTYSRTINVPQSNCVTYTNTATLVEAKKSSNRTVKVCGPANTGALTIGFWQGTNGQSIITGQANSGLCPSAAWLTQYNPFMDLSSTADCSTTATYVSNIITAANASGSSMNARLKAQMLATALNVYFSDPSLGGNIINAPAPLGSVKIDLHKICQMVDGSGGTATCNGTLQNVSNAFGGSQNLTVSQMLTYAASQANLRRQHLVWQREGDPATRQGCFRLNQQPGGVCPIDRGSHRLKAEGARWLFSSRLRLFSPLTILMLY